MNSNQQRSELQQAFHQFNQVSDRLIESFNQLNASVDGISASTVAGQISQQQNTMSQQLRALIDAIPGAVIVINPQGQVVDFNLSASELLGEPLKHCDWRDIVNRVFLAELDQGELRTPDGRQFSISTRPLGYQPGQILLLSDVTQTRMLQRTAQQNLHLMTMGKMMASLAHQIRTPLSSTMLYLSQIIEGNLDAEKSQKFTGKALDRIRHIEKTINDMLVFAHGGQFHMSDFSIADLLDELQDQLAPQLKLHQASIEIEGAEKNMLVNGNKDALLGALANLCMNAIDARSGSLSIDIKISLNNKGNLNLNVQDNAKGMDDNVLQHLFDPFYTTKQDGTGLGLAVVKSVIESHQGQISVSSIPGEGSCFDISLPCLQASKTQLSSQHNEEQLND